MCIICRGEDISHLQILDCSWCNFITILPKLPETLRVLNCSYTNISFLPELPETLENLNCSSTNIEFLGKLSKNLLYLRCTFTRIKALPKLPEKLLVLYCKFCPNLTSLPKLPKSLETLYLYKCKNLTFLPDLPEGLELLDCEETRISKIPITHAFVRKEYCFWLGKNCEEYIQILVKIQRFVKKFLFRKRVRIFSIFRKLFPKDIIPLIL